MKVYKLNRQIDWSKFNHPEDMQKIMKYLEDHGEILVSASTIEVFYYDYSESVCCGWRTVDETSLAEFAEWLDEYDM